MNGTQTAIDGGINSLCIPRCRFSNEMRWRTAAWSSLFIRQHKIPSTNCLPMSVLLKLFCGCTICWLKIVDGVAGMRPGDKLRTRKSRDDGSATELKKRNIFFCSLAIVPLWMAGLQFYKTGTDQRRTFVIIWMQWSSWIQTCKTGDQRYSNTFHNGECSLVLITLSPHSSLSLSLSLSLSHKLFKLTTIRKHCSMQGPTYSSNVSAT